MFFNSFVFSNTDFKGKYLEIVSPFKKHAYISRKTKENVIRLLSKHSVPNLIKRAIVLLEQFDNGDTSCVQELVLNFETLANIIPDEADLFGYLEDNLLEHSVSLESFLQQLQDYRIYFGKFLEFYYSWYEAAGLEQK